MNTSQKSIPNTPAMVVSQPDKPVKQSLLHRFQTANRRRRHNKFTIGYYLTILAWGLCHKDAVDYARKHTDFDDRIIMTAVFPITVPVAFVLGRLVSATKLVLRLFNYVWYGE